MRAASEFRGGLEPGSGRGGVLVGGGCGDGVLGGGLAGGPSDRGVRTALGPPIEGEGRARLGAERGVGEGEEGLPDGPLEGGGGRIMVFPPF